MKRLLSALLAVVVTAGCLWFLLTPDIVRSLGRVAADAQPLPILAAFALGILVQWLRAWRFAMLTSGRLALPQPGLVRIALQLNFLNFVLPFRLGELGFPVLMRQRYGTSLLHSAGVLVLARLFDLATVGCILLAAAALLGMAPGLGNLALAVGALALGLAPFALALIGQAMRPRMAGLAYIGAVAEPLSAGLDAIGDVRVRTAAIGVGYAIWLVLGLMAVLVAQAVVATVSAGAAVMGGAAGNLAFALPVNGIAGIGPAQAAWVAAIVRVGVPWDDAVISALALHAVVLVNALVLGAIAMLPWPGDKAAA